MPRLKGRFSPNNSKWKVNEFKYGEQGITKSGAQGHYIPNKTWLKASRTLGKTLFGNCRLYVRIERIEQSSSCSDEAGFGQIRRSDSPQLPFQRKRRRSPARKRRH